MRPSLGPGHAFTVVAPENDNGGLRQAVFLELVAERRPALHPFIEHPNGTALAQLCIEQGRAGPAQQGGGVIAGLGVTIEDTSPPSITVGSGAALTPIGEEVQRIAEVRQFLHEINLGATAIGAALAQPDRLPVAALGDGGALMALGIGPGDTVVIPTVCYPTYEVGARLAGATVVRSDSLTALGPTPRVRLIWVNSPGNPDGRVLPAQHLRKVVDWARERGAVVASDECYVDIHPVGAEPPPSLLQAAGDDRSGVLVAFSLSKRSGMTGYRSGALVGDADLIAAQRTLRPNIGTASPEFVQQAAAVAWSDDAHVAERRALFDAKRAIILEFARRTGLRVSGSSATFYVWLAAPGGDDVAYAKALLRERVVVSPGSAFGTAGRGWLRLALVPSADGCSAATSAWSNAIAAGRLPGHD